jgi:hypothetical protein
MSPAALAALGEHRLGYVKAMRSEEVAFISADAPLLAAGHRVFVLHDADGTPIIITDNHEEALAHAASRRIEALSLH